MTVTNNDSQVTAESCMERNIKDLLAEYPVLGDILNEYGIGCVTCTVGTCLLKEIVQYHYLPDAQQAELMARMAEAIEQSGGSGQKPASAVNVREVKINYSPPMQTLVNEHVLIKRWLALMPPFADKMNLQTESDRQLLADGIDFLHNFADRYHHAKEEDILFDYFDQNQEIIRVIREDHTRGRYHISEMLAALAVRNRAALAVNMLAYHLLLSEHISKEDEVLFPWMDRQLTPETQGELTRAFMRADENAEPGLTERYENFLIHAEEVLAIVGSM